MEKTRKNNNTIADQGHDSGTHRTQKTSNNQTHLSNQKIRLVGELFRVCELKIPPQFKSNRN